MTFSPVEQPPIQWESSWTPSIVMLLFPHWAHTASQVSTVVCSKTVHWCLSPSSLHSTLVSTVKSWNSTVLNLFGVETPWAKSNGKSFSTFLNLFLFLLVPKSVWVNNTTMLHGKKRNPSGGSFCWRLEHAKRRILAFSPSLFCFRLRYYTVSLSECRQSAFINM